MSAGATERGRAAGRGPRPDCTGEVVAEVGSRRAGRIRTVRVSGVTVWGDSVQIAADCNRPAVGEQWVELPGDARDTVDRLIRQASVQVGNGDEATTAWSLALTWLDAINARAIVSYDQTAEEIGRWRILSLMR